MTQWSRILEMIRYDITTGPIESLGDVYINGELIDPENYELRYDCINDISYALFLKEYGTPRGKPNMYPVRLITGKTTKSPANTGIPPVTIVD